jgi:acyl-CoA reductase-like NAD-dependent aldehyde dehydrogenase
MIEILQGYDGAPIVTLETDDASALESKLSAAARLFTDRKSWQEPFERIAILHRLSVLLEGKREHFGLQIAREGGKPLADALIEVDRGPSMACGTRPTCCAWLRVRRFRWA